MSCGWVRMDSAIMSGPVGRPCARGVGVGGALRFDSSCPYTTQDRQRKVLAVLATGYTLTASPNFTLLLRSDIYLIKARNMRRLVRRLGYSNVKRTKALVVKVPYTDRR